MSPHFTPQKQLYEGTGGGEVTIITTLDSIKLSIDNKSMLFLRTEAGDTSSFRSDLFSAYDSSIDCFSLRNFKIEEITSDTFIASHKIPFYIKKRLHCKSKKFLLKIEREQLVGVVSYPTSIAKFLMGGYAVVLSLGSAGLSLCEYGDEVAGVYQGLIGGGFIVISIVEAAASGWDELSTILSIIGIGCTGTAFYNFYYGERHSKSQVFAANAICISASFGIGAISASIHSKIRERREWRKCRKKKMYTYLH